MIKTFLKLLHIFGKEDYPKFVMYAIGVLLSSLLEIVGIGLILPFMTLLGKPDLLATNPWINKVYTLFHFQDFGHFMIFIASGIILVFVLKSIMLFFVSYWQIKFVYDKQNFLSTRLFRAYLMSPYSFHLRGNLAQLQRNLSVIPGIMQCIVLQMFNILTEGVLVMALFIILLCSQPLLTLGVMVILGACLSIYFSFSKKKLQAWSEVSNHHSTLIGQQINQGFGSIKEAKLFGRESFFVDRYKYHWEQVSLKMSKIDVLTRSPRLFIEMVVVSLIMAAIIVYLVSEKPLEQIFSMVSLFAIVAIRLMPSLNRMSAAWGSIKAGVPIFNEVYEDVFNCESLDVQSKQEDPLPVLNFTKTIEMKELSFTYEGASRLALDHLNLVIPKNSTVGFVGSSGAGKTTIIDIILGLLKPSLGQVLVDGKDIYENLRSWQDQLGYIPQSIYLCDDTIKSNIAFGLEAHQIDEEKVWRALRLAQLEEFIKALPDGIETTVGERGIRLSGGQRQRIGIARALYNDPQILVMDEATAALDNETERSFMDSLSRLSGAKTILIIAHRLTTVRKCEKIFFLKNGKLTAQGTYDELVNNSPEFNQMAGLGNL